MKKFIGSLVEEAKKVIWPTRETVAKHSIMVVVTIIIATLIIAGIDLGFKELVVLALK
ncbi:preprotein translocase subunit SecE [Candidatus Berkelbacteria bacterium]|nr:preprotein translocase subunit SecE [Candidatus Berkelbacteria bacterium]